MSDSFPADAEVDADRSEIWSGVLTVWLTSTRASSPIANPVEGVRSRGVFALALKLQSIWLIALRLLRSSSLFNKRHARGVFVAYSIQALIARS